jgi:hypothetical protein
MKGLPLKMTGGLEMGDFAGGRWVGELITRLSTMGFAVGDLATERRIGELKMGDALGDLAEGRIGELKMGLVGGDLAAEGRRIGELMKLVREEVVAVGGATVGTMVLGQPVEESIPALALHPPP